MLTAEEAAEALGLSRTAVFAMIRSGELQSVKIASRRRIPLTVLQPGSGLGAVDLCAPAGAGDVALGASGGAVDCSTGDGDPSCGAGLLRLGHEGHARDRLAGDGVNLGDRRTTEDAGVADGHAARSCSGAGHRRGDGGGLREARGSRRLDDPHRVADLHIAGQVGTGGCA
nr:helix-turn-helix domain-containing protein [Nakamurella lactea]